MSRKIITAVALAAVAATSLVPMVANATGKHHMRVVDNKSGKTVFDDGVDDDKLCAAKKVTTFNTDTQEFEVTFKKVKCNF